MRNFYLHSTPIVTLRKLWGRSQWLLGLRLASTAARLLGLPVRILLGAWMSYSNESCVLPGRYPCVGLITHPEESYLLRCVFECDLGNLTVRLQ